MSNPNLPKLITIYNGKLVREVILPIYKSDTDPLRMYCQFENTISCDRFGYLNRFSNWRFPEKAISPIPNFTHCKNFTDITINRAKEFMEMSVRENKDIYVSFSGGVDSTCIVCAFLLCGVNKKQFHLLYTSASVEEYPYFFELMRKEGIDCILCNFTNIHLLYDFYSKNDILIFGNCGDQLYGSAINLLYPEWFHKSYKDFCKNFSYSDLAIEQLDEAFRNYNVPISKTSEFLWWMNFSIKHERVKYGEMMQIKTHNLFHSFYDTKEYDDWACCHFGDKDKSLPTDPKYYRPEQKEIIYKYTKDKEYIDTKIKKGSWVSSTCRVDSSVVSYYTTEGVRWCPVPHSKNELLKYRKDVCL